MHYNSWQKKKKTFQLLWSTTAQSERLCTAWTAFPSNIISMPTACPLTWHSKVPLWMISGKAQQGAVTVRHPYSHTAGPLSATNCLQLIYMQKRARKRRLIQYVKEYELVSVEAWFTLINKDDSKEKKNMIKVTFSNSLLLIPYHKPLPCLK